MTSTAEAKWLKYTIRMQRATGLSPRSGRSSEQVLSECQAFGKRIT